MLSLPIDSHLQDIVAALRRSNALILQASPGTGKTTRVPPALMEVITGKILVLEPRRIAARMAAQRIADELGEPCGQRIGYRVRFEQNVSAQTRVEFLTEGLFLRLLQDNPTLKGVGCILLDEFHERHIHTDTALALVRNLQQNERPDLRLVLMSATLPGEDLKAYLPDAAMVSVMGKMHPVRIDYKTDDSPEHAVLNLLTDKDCNGHILVFLPGARDIHLLAEKLSKYSREHEFDVLMLYGSMNLKEQRAIFEPSKRRKVVLTTNIAETSITIDGVTGVVDTGTAKISGFANWSGLPTLSLRPVSQASAVQRAGRAGRTEAGVTVRLYSSLDFSRRPPFEKAELHRTDLTQLVLDIKFMTSKLGTTFTMESMPWFEPPDAERVTLCAALLRRLDAIDSTGKITDVGSKMVKMPLHPRLARIILEGKSRGCSGNAVLAAAALGEGALRSENERNESKDFFEILEAFRQSLLRTNRNEHSGIRRVIDQIASEAGTNLSDCLKPLDEDALTVCLFKGFFDRVRPSPQKTKNSQFVLVLDAQENPYAKSQQVTIRSSIPIDAEVLLEGPQDLLVEENEIIWEEQRQKVRKVSRLSYDGLTIEDSDLPLADEEAEPVLRKALKDLWPKPFGDVSELFQLRGRINFVRSQRSDVELPTFDEELPDALLAVFCHGQRSFTDIAARPLSSYLDELIPDGSRRLFNEIAPTHFQLSPRRRVPIHYEEGKPPWLESRIQDFFGRTASPTINQNRTPLILHLLAPNGRAEQVTGDLAGFWQNVYPKLRSSLGRRYPRHSWPEDPRTATPPAPKERR
ncbi:MAG: ATP-dependent helicase HrpB [Oligoflexales bacterium]